jgi:hypothetical protein
MGKSIDLTGKQFGRLTVVAKGPQKGNKTYWICRCECGATSTPYSGSLRSGRTKSCGCLSRQAASNRATRHGHSRVGKRSLTYSTWVNMIERCKRTQATGWSRYGGRGIRVCKRWANSFEAFLADMGERPSQSHSIDRKENGGNYEPGNCRWSTKREQANNRRTSVFIEAEGKKLTIAQWAVAKGLNDSAIRRRIQLGWNPVAAVLTPKTKPVCRGGRFTRQQPK